MCSALLPSARQLGVLVLVCLLLPGLVPGCARSDETPIGGLPGPQGQAPATTPAGDTDTLVVGRLTPLPEDLAATRERASGLRTSGDLQVAIAEHAAFLAQVAERWGAEDPRVEPYDYDHCVLLREAGELEASLEHARAWLAHHPRSLHHRVLETTTLVRMSELDGQLRPGTLDGVLLLVEPHNQAKLAALHIDSPPLLLAVAAVLLRAEEWDAGLDCLQRAASWEELRPIARLQGAQILAQIHRFEEALSWLEQMPADSLEGTVLRAESLLGLGRGEDAWRVCEPALGTWIGSKPLARRLRLAGANALAHLGRHELARDLLVTHLLTDPIDIAALRSLAASMRALDRMETAAAIETRAQELAPHADLEEHRAKATAAERAGSATFFHALQLEAVDQHGPAMAFLDAACARDSSPDYLFVLTCELRLQAGLLDEALSLAEARCRAGGSFLLRASTARLAARAGRDDDARAMLGSIAGARASSPQLQAVLDAYRMRALVELGDLDGARELLPTLEAAVKSGATSPVPEILTLARAELELRDLSGASAPDTGALHQSLRYAAGGDAWARALLHVLAARAGDTLPADASPLLDHPRLLALVPESPASPLLAKVQRLSTNAEIMAAIEACCEAGCLIRARRLAWTLWQRQEGDAHSELLLARTLRRDEEILERYAAVERGLARAPANSALLELRAEARSALGLLP